MSIQGVNRVDQKLNYFTASKAADAEVAVLKDEPDESGKINLTLACLGALGAAAVGYLFAHGRAGRIIRSLRYKIEEAEKAAKSTVSEKKAQKLNNKVAEAKAGAGEIIKKTEPKVAGFKAYGIIGGEKGKFVAEHTASFKQDFVTAATVIDDLNGRKILEKKDFEVIQEISKLPSFNGANVNAENWVAGNLKVKEAVVGLLARLKGCFKEDEKIASAFSKAKSDLADYAIYQISGEGRAQTKEECQKAISIVAKYPEEAKKARPRFSLSGIVSSNANQHDIRVSENDMSKLESLDEIWC